MKFQIGDDIIVLLSNEEGKVVEIINEKLVMVEVRGVKFPAYTDQLDFPYYKRFTEKLLVPEKKKEKKFIDQVPREKPGPATIRVEEGVWLCFLPKFTLDEFNDEVVELFKLHLVNKTGQGFHFTYTQEYFGKPDFEFKNEILSHQDFYLHDLPFACLNDSPSFHFEFTQISPEKNKAPFLETSLKPKPRQIFQKVEAMKEKNEPVFSYLLFEKYPDKIEEDPLAFPSQTTQHFRVYEANKIKQHLEPARSVIDLHIEKLTESWEHLSNFEMLTLQLGEFEKWLELAIAHRMESMVVIHGVGTGKLRDEIHEILKVKREVRFFINQYDPRYGYGATEIFFQY